jgi:hypothetical protein
MLRAAGLVGPSNCRVVGHSTMGRSRLAQERDKREKAPAILTQFGLDIPGDVT